MGIRTPDLLHAITRRHIHPGPSPQATVLRGLPESAQVRAGYGTSLLYPGQESTPRPHAGNPSAPAAEQLRERYGV
jgi:hypothetical protein